MRWALPILFALAAIGLTLVYLNVWAGPIEAQVQPSMVRFENGELRALVRWPVKPDGNFRQRDIAISEEYLDARVVPIRIVGDDEVKVVSRGVQWPSWQVVLVVGAFGALTGLVIALTLAGFGFVRGTGESGSMTREDVREDRGFYWRS